MPRINFRLIVKVLIGALFVCVGYYAIVMIIGYVQTPGLVARRIAQVETRLKVEQLSAEYLRILLEVEDPEFFSHKGIDLSTPGAGLTTITQGLAKDLYFEQFRPGGLAKLRQSLLALVLNQRITKQEQLYLFINTVYLGNHEGVTVSGFVTAARVYFDREFAALTREEYLALVAMIIAPNDFNVATHPEKNAQRVHRIERLLRGECKPAGLRDVYYVNCDA